MQINTIKKYKRRIKLTVTSKEISRENCHCSASLMKEILPTLERIDGKLSGMEQLLSCRPKMEVPDILTLDETAAYLRLSAKRVYELLTKGSLQSLPHKKHHRIFFSKSQLNKYLYETKI